MSSENPTRLGHSLPGVPIPAVHAQHQHYQRQQLQHPSSSASTYQIPDQQHDRPHVAEYFHTDNASTTPSIDPVSYGLERLRGAVDLTMHGVIALLSVYSFGAIVLTLQFQAQWGAISSSALFLFFAMGMSLVFTFVYLGLACWGHTASGTEMIREWHQYQQHQQRQSAEQEKPRERNAEAPWTFLAAVFMLTPRRRMWIQIVLTVLSLASATLESYKIRNAGNCDMVPLLFQHVCRTTKAAAYSAYLVAFAWMLWVTWCYYRTVLGAPVISQGVSRSGITQEDGQQQPQQQQQQQQQQQLQRGGDVLIAMPEKESGSTTVSRGGSAANMMEVGKSVGIVASGAGVAAALDMNKQPHQSQQQQQPAAASSQAPQRVEALSQQPHGPTAGVASEDVDSDSSLGLGIDICTKTTAATYNAIDSSPSSCIVSNDAAASTNASAVVRENTINRDAAAGKRVVSNDIEVAAPPPRSHSIGDLVGDVGRARAQNAASGMYRPRNNSACFTTTGSYSASGSVSSVNPARMRDHAKIFMVPRSKSGSLHEVGGYYSARNTPQLQSTSRDRFPVSGTPSNMGVGFSPYPSTPSTPLSRGGVGYMGAHTLKAFNSSGGLPRTVSMGYIAAFNNSSSGGGGRPGAFSAQTSPMVGPLDMAPMQAGFRGGHQSMSSFFDPAFSTAPGDLEAAGTSSPRGPLRMSFSSPNLNSYRRRSSLGLKSVLNSMLSASASARDSDSSSISSCTSSSGASSPRSITSPLDADSDALAFEEHKKRQQATTAEELMRAEYGHLLSTNRGMEPEQPGHQNHNSGFLSAPGTSRSRSASVSSNSTSKSSSSSKSDSTSDSTISNLTSLSNDDRTPSTIAPDASFCPPVPVTQSGPPLTFLNKMLVGSYQQKKQQQQQYHGRHHSQQGGGGGGGGGGSLRRGASSGNLSNSDLSFLKTATGRGSCSGDSTPISKKFPSQGDLCHFESDYRKALPVD
ncbi:hypothetical protein BGZ98_008583 [Dissophora globulifera]|nr:hypothetical protein BGZ98_008583 [Dissophora globulifera]